MAYLSNYSLTCQTVDYSNDPLAMRVSQLKHAHSRTATILFSHTPLLASPLHLDAQRTLVLLHVEAGRFHWHGKQRLFLVRIIYQTLTYCDDHAFLFCLHCTSVDCVCIEKERQSDHVFARVPSLHHVPLWLDRREVRRRWSKYVLLCFSHFPVTTMTCFIRHSC